MRSFLLRFREVLHFLHAEEEGRRIENADITESLDLFIVVFEDFRILAVGIDIFGFVL